MDRYLKEPVKVYYLEEDFYSHQRGTDDIVAVLNSVVRDDNKEGLP